MTREERKSRPAVPRGVEGPLERRKLHEDLVLLLLALILLLIPAWIGTAPSGSLRFEEGSSTSSVLPVRIDINEAPWYQWLMLEGIGEARARSIVEYREQHGPFSSVDGLKVIPRMPAGWVEKSRPHFVVGKP